MPRVLDTQNKLFNLSKLSILTVERHLRRKTIESTWIDQEKARSKESEPQVSLSELFTFSLISSMLIPSILDAFSGEIESLMEQMNILEAL